MYIAECVCYSKNIMDLIHTYIYMFTSNAYIYVNGFMHMP